MAVTVSFDPAAKNRNGGWVVNQQSGGLFGARVGNQSIHTSQSAAISAARRMASQGERIVLNRKSGGRRVIRSGR